jgi:hypothetical protein
VAWLEDDNLFLDDHLAHFENAAIKYPAATLFGSVGVVFTELNGSWHRDIFCPVWRFDLYLQEPVVISTDLALATYFYGSPIASSAVMIKRDVMEIEGNFKNCDCWMPLDRWLWSEFAALGETIYIPKQTMLYRIHGSNHTKNIKRKQHIEENQKIAGLILEKMQQLGIQPRAALSKLAAVSDFPAARNMHILNLLRFRRWNWVKEYMPITMGKSSFLQCIPGILRIAFQPLLTKLLGR